MTSETPLSRMTSLPARPIEPETSARDAPTADLTSFAHGALLAIALAGLTVGGVLGLLGASSVADWAFGISVAVVLI
jgi:hypothetical protein